MSHVYESHLHETIPKCFVGLQSEVTSNFMMSRAIKPRLLSFLVHILSINTASKECPKATFTKQVIYTGQIIITSKCAVAYY